MCAILIMFPPLLVITCFISASGTVDLTFEADFFHLFFPQSPMAVIRSFFVEFFHGMVAHLMKKNVFLVMNYATVLDRY